MRTVNTGVKNYEGYIPVHAARRPAYSLALKLLPLLLFSWKIVGGRLLHSSLAETRCFLREVAGMLLHDG